MLYRGLNKAFIKHSLIKRERLNTVLSVLLSSKYSPTEINTFSGSGSTGGGAFLFLDIFFWSAAARTAFPLTSSCGDEGRELGTVPAFLLGVEPPPRPPSRRGYWTFRVSSRLSVTHSSSLLLSENKRRNYLIHTSLQIFMFPQKWRTICTSATTKI